jgi:hypothetical protein
VRAALHARTWSNLRGSKYEMGVSWPLSVSHIAPPISLPHWSTFAWRSAHAFST